MTKIKSETKKRAVSPERMIALALAAVLDAIADGPPTEDLAVRESSVAAKKTLDELGYSKMVGIPKQIAALTAELETATKAKDWKRVSELGAALDRVRLGKSPKVAPVQSVAKKSTRKPRSKSPAANTEEGKASAGGVSEKCAITNCEADSLNPAHDPKSEEFDHVFHAEIKKKAGTA